VWGGDPEARIGFLLQCTLILRFFFSQFTMLHAYSLGTGLVPFSPGKYTLLVRTNNNLVTVTVCDCVVCMYCSCHVVLLGQLLTCSAHLSCVQCHACVVHAGLLSWS